MLFEMEFQAVHLQRALAAARHEIAHPEMLLGRLKHDHLLARQRLYVRSTGMPLMGRAAARRSTRSSRLPT